MKTNTRCTSGVRNTRLYGNIVLFCLAFVFSLVTSAQGIAASYYVDGASGNDTYAGTQAQPWKTISKAGTTARAGDIVLFRPGTYNGSLRPSYSGTAGNLITFKADTGCGCQGGFGQNKTGCQVIFDGQGSTGTAVELADRQYIRVEGFEIRNYTTCGVHATQSGGPPYKISGCEIVNNYIHDLGNVASPSTSVEGISSGMCDTILLQNNEIYRSAGYGIGNGSCVNLHYLGNTIHSVGYDGFSFGNANASYPLSGVIERNRLYDSYAGDTHQDAFQMWGHINGLVIRYNSLSDFTQLCYISTPDSDGPCQIQNIEIYGNVFFNDKYKSVMGADLQGIFFDGRGTRHAFERNIYIHDNTFGFLGYSPVWMYDEAIDGVRIQNNAYYGTQGIADITAGSTNITISGNYTQPLQIPAWSGDPNGSTNLPPTANAGPDQSVTDTDNNGSHSVTLNGSGSYDSDDSITSYVWKEGSTQIATGVTPTVTLTVGQHTITLTDTDNGGLTAADTVVITVQAPVTNTPPTANAGPDQTVTDTDNNGSQSVTLNGSGSSDTGGSIMSYVWKEGSTQIATGVTPSVTLAVGQHTITLTVTDNGGLTATDTVVITVKAPTNTPPAANAGPDQTVTDTDNNGSQSVTLNGSASSDTGGSITSYVWKEGSTQKATGVTPSVTLTVGQHTLTLTVTDNGGLTATDTVVITVQAPANTPPTANAGPDQTVTDTDNNGSQSVTLNGSASSDTGGSIANYVWKEGSTQIATGVTPTVTLAVGQHTITLTDTDNGGLTASDTVVVTIQASTSNTPPIANAGPDQTVTDTDNNGNQRITLNGSGSSDPDGNITRYAWKEGDYTFGIGASVPVTLAVGIHTITLTVTDNNDLTATDTINIKVNAPNNPPIADAGPDQTVTDTDNNGRQRVYLNGTHSSDPNGNITSYVWKEGRTTVASGAVRLVTLTVGTHNITLTATDNRGVMDTDTVVIKVNAANQTLASDAGSDQTVADFNTDTAVMTVNASGAEAEAGMVGYWKFDDGSGQTAVDSSGSNLAGLLVNGPMWTTQGEISFDGNDDAIEINTANMSINNGTIAMWVHPDAFLNNKNFLFGEATQPWSNRIQLYCDQYGALNLGMGDNPYLKTGIQALNAGEWYHIALTWDDTNYTVYVDGVQKVTGTYSGLSSLANYADIGNNGNSSTRTEAFDGLIDEVQVYNIAIEAEEIANIALVFLPVDNKTVAAGDELNFTVRTKSGTTVSLENSNLPGTPSFASNTFKWTPDVNDAGTYQVEFTASNGSLTNFESIKITVTDAPTPDANVDGLVGYWKFDDGSGTTTADSSTNGTSGLLVNGPAWTGQGELSFDGSDDAVQISTTNMKASSGTIALWVRPDAFLNSKNFLFGEATQPESNRIQLYCNQSGALNVEMGNNAYQMSNSQTLNAGQWYHIALTWDGTNYRVLVNGSTRAIVTYSGLTQLNATADIGNNGNTSTRSEGFNGLIDEVRIYDKALTAGEIVGFASSRQ